MECAIVLAKRGFERVRLVDAGRRHRRLHALGPAAARARRRGARLSTGGGRSSTGSRTSSRDGRPPERRRRARYGAGIVIVATGAHWSPTA